MRSLRNARGFTLIELMLVLGLIALIFAIGISPFKKSLARTAVQGAALRIASDLRAMRDRAIQLEEYAGIVVLYNDATSQYSYATFEVLNTTDGTVPAGVTTGCMSLPPPPSDALSRWIQQVSLSSEYGGAAFRDLIYESRVVFNPGGQAGRYDGDDTGDTTPPSGIIQFQIWNGDSTIAKTVILNAYSGNVQVQ